MEKCWIVVSIFSIVCTNFSMKTSVYFLLFLYNVGKHWLDFWLIFDFETYFSLWCQWINWWYRRYRFTIISKFIYSFHWSVCGFILENNRRFWFQNPDQANISISRKKKKKSIAKYSYFDFTNFFLFQIFCIWNWSQWILWWRMLIYNCHLWWFWRISWGITSSMWYRYML